MVLKADQERLKALLSETVLLLCKNGLEFKSDFCIEALIGITVDQDDVFLISIKETVENELRAAQRAKEEAEKLALEAAQSPAPESPSRTHRKRKRKSPRPQSPSQDKNIKLETSGDRELDNNTSNTSFQDYNDESQHSRNMKFESGGAGDMGGDDEDNSNEIVFVKTENTDDQSLYGGPGQSSFLDSPYQSGMDSSQMSSSFQSPGAHSSHPGTSSWQSPMDSSQQGMSQNPLETQQTLTDRYIVERADEATTFEITQALQLPTKTRQRVIREQENTDSFSAASKRQWIKLQRDSGQGYVNREGKIVPPKTPSDEPCKCPNKCFVKFDKECRHAIFNQYWGLGSYDAQTSYLFSHIKLVQIKRRRPRLDLSVESRRTVSTEFFLENRNGERVRVCKSAFQRIHGIKDKRVAVVKEKIKLGQTQHTGDARGKHFKDNDVIKYTKATVDFVIEHIRLCKASGKIWTHKRMFDDYRAVYCVEKGIKPVAFAKYYKLLGTTEND